MPRRTSLPALLLLIAAAACVACGRKPIVEHASAAPPPSRGAWLRGLGGEGTDTADAVAGDRTGAIYVAGTFTAPMQVGDATLPLTTSRDAYLVKLSSRGDVEWARTFAGANPGALAVAADGTLVLAGSFLDAAAFGPVALVSAGGSDAFVARLTDAGEPIWARAIGGPGRDTASQVAVDGLGNVLVVGDFSGELPLDARTLTARGGTDVFVARLDGATGLASTAVGVGSAASDSARFLAVDSARHATIVGTFGDKLTLGGTEAKPSGGDDVFAMRFNTGGN